MVIDPRARVCARTRSRAWASPRAERRLPAATVGHHAPSPTGAPLPPRSARQLPPVLWLLLCALLLTATPGCKSKQDRADFFLPNTHSELLPPRSGSLAELKDKEEDKRRKQAQKERGPQDTTIVLVAYDNKGKPTAVELRRSSGNAVNDRRAMEFVYKHKTFPPGKANMMLVEVDPKTLPKPKEKEKARSGN